MKQEERLLKRGRGEGKVQDFNKYCTFFLHNCNKKLYLCKYEGLASLLAIIVPIFSFFFFFIFLFSSFALFSAPFHSAKLRGGKEKNQSIKKETTENVYRATKQSEEGEP